MNRTTLNKATSPDPNPTPGYLFDEIAKVTHDPIGNDRLLEYLLKRLESPSPDVKAKVLNIIKHVCRKGNPSFRRAWQREAGVIKAHLQFHTVPDPLRGDEPSKRVREAATTALEAVFDASKDEKKPDSTLSSRIQGFGVAAPVATANSSSSSESNMPSLSSTAYFQQQQQLPQSSGGGRSQINSYEGIGNPNFHDARTQPKGFMERVVDVVREKVEKHAEAIPGVAGVKPPWMNQELPGGYTFASNRVPSQYSGSSGSYDPSLNQRREDTWSDPRTSTRPPPVVNAVPIRNNSNRQSTHRTSEPSNGVHESSLINELCAPGGVRPVPPKDKLDSFCRACRTLEPSIIVRLLNEKLAEEDWKIQHKALCVLEIILQSPELSTYADKLDESPDQLEALYSSRNPSVREKAQKVWKLLYDDADEINNNSNGEDHSSVQQQSYVQNQKEKEIDLLDFGEPQVGAPIESVKPSSAAAPPTMRMTDMFQNLNVKGTSTTTSNLAPKAASPSGFSFLSKDSPSIPTPSSSLDMLDFSSPMPPNSSSSNSSNLFSTIPPAPTTKTNSQILDLFSSTNLPQANNSMSGVPSFGILPRQQQQQQQQQLPPITKVNVSQNNNKKPDSFGFVQEALQETRRA